MDNSNKTVVENSPWLSKIWEYFSIVMAASYFVFGIWLLSTNQLNYIPREYKILMAVFLFALGFARATRLYYRIRRKSEENEN